MKRGSSAASGKGGPSAAVWIIAISMSLLSGLVVLELVFSEPTAVRSVTRFVAINVAIATVAFIAYWRLARTHGVKQVQASMQGPMRILAVLATIGALLLFLGIPLYFLRLGGQIWK